MPYLPIIFFLILFLPSSLSAQVLEQEPSSSKQLKDPDDFPFGFNLFLGLPGTAISRDLGYQNLHALFDSKGIGLPKFRTMVFYGVGFRYKRLYADMSLSSLFGTFPLELYGEPSFNTVSSQSVNMISVGVSIFQNRNAAFLLKAGFGEATSSFWVTPLETGVEVDFDQIEQVDSPIAFPHVFHKSTFLDVGIEVFQGRAKSRTSLSQSIRLGYRDGLNEKAWQAVNASTVNAPVDRFRQVYVQVLFTFGANWVKKNKL